MPQSLVTRTGDLASLLQLVALDARIRQAERTELDIVRRVNEHRLGIETLTRFIEDDRARLGKLGERDGGRARLEWLIETRQRQITGLTGALEVDLRCAEPALERVRETARAAHSERDQILRSLDRALVERYEMLMRQGTLSFIVPAKDGCCGGCAARLSPASAENLQQRDTLVICARCGRMLYGRGLRA
jgi:predicted  nucleic acid-binding Zn-ribbon protein